MKGERSIVHWPLMPRFDSPPVRRALFVVTFSFAVFASLAARAQKIDWIRQIASSDAFDVSPDALGNVFVSGTSGGSLGPVYVIDEDGFVAKYNQAGQLLWNKSLDSANNEWVTSVAADGLGNVYAAGWTNGSLGAVYTGCPGCFDMFLVKYDSAGTRTWLRQWGTAGIEHGWGVALDGLGSIFVSGGYDDPSTAPFGHQEFLNRYNSSGTLVRSTIHGIADRHQEVRRVSADRLGNVYITGRIQNVPSGNAHIYVSKYLSDGSFQWIRESDAVTAADLGEDVAVDGLGNVFIAGETQASLAGQNAGSLDAVVAKYDTNGNQLWVRQFGTASSDVVQGLSADDKGNIYVTGSTAGNLGGANAGGDDIFIRKLDESGNTIWTKQFGTNKLDFARNVTADGFDNIYLAGSTTGNLGATLTGKRDGFVAKLIDPMHFGDFNADGRVNAADYTIWRNDGGRHYDRHYYDLWKANYGTTIQYGAAAAVPEPGIFTLIAGAFVNWLATSHRRRNRSC